eukprot:51000-Pyramimonas_sp.AAC.1
MQPYRSRLVILLPSSIERGRSRAPPGFRVSVFPRAPVQLDCSSHDPLRIGPSPVSLPRHPSK